MTTIFLYWGADDTRDVFAGYTFTLESGFPSEAIIVVLRSLHTVPLHRHAGAQVGHFLREGRFLR